MCGGFGVVVQSDGVIPAEIVSPEFLDALRALPEEQVREIVVPRTATIRPR